MKFRHTIYQIRHGLTARISDFHSGGPESSPGVGIMFFLLIIVIAVIFFNLQYSEDRKQAEQVRGMGTDVGIVSSMVFLAQFILSISMGNIISAFQSTTAVIVAASVLSFCGSVTASFVTYLDL